MKGSAIILFLTSWVKSKQSRFLLFHSENQWHIVDDTCQSNGVLYFFTQKQFQHFQHYRFFFDTLHK